MFLKVSEVLPATNTACHHHLCHRLTYHATYPPMQLQIHSALKSLACVNVKFELLYKSLCVVAVWHHHHQLLESNSMSPGFCSMTDLFFSNIICQEKNIQSLNVFNPVTILLSELTIKLTIHNHLSIAQQITVNFDQSEMQTRLVFEPRQL